MNKMINLKDLKSAVLKHTFEGKLTNQEPSDGCVNDLVQQIEQEQLKLIKDKKIKADSKIGKIVCRNNSFYEIINKKEVCIDEQIRFQIL